MSAYLQLTVECNKCGRVLFRGNEVGSDDGMRKAQYDAAETLRKQGALVNRRYRGHTVHYCQKCADGHLVERYP